MGDKSWCLPTLVSIRSILCRNIRWRLVESFVQNRISSDDVREMVQSFEILCRVVLVFDFAVEGLDGNVGQTVARIG